MDFNVKKLVKDAGAALSRVVQLTEETLGTSEKTELDAHFEHLAERANTTKSWTERILRNMEAMLTPNPGNRIEDFFYEKIDKKKPNRLSNLEYVGIDMIEAGNDFGPGIVYGGALIKVGQCEQKLGQIERDFIGTAANCYIQPLRKFLDGEMKTISKEMAILESKRLDLDACKNRVRKARSMLGQQSAERELRMAQSEFDRQAEITKLLLEGVSSSQAGHLRCLHEFVEAQARHYAQCHAVMQELQRELAGVSLMKRPKWVELNCCEGTPNLAITQTILRRGGRNKVRRVDSNQKLFKLFTAPERHLQKWKINCGETFCKKSRYRAPVRCPSKKAPQPSPLLRVNSEEMVEPTPSSAYSESVPLCEPLPDSTYVTATFDTDITRI